MENQGRTANSHRRDSLVGGCLRVVIYPDNGARVCETGHATVVLRQNSAHSSRNGMSVKVGRLSLPGVPRRTDKDMVRCNSFPITRALPVI